MTTNVPAPSFGVTGFVAPSEADVLAGVEADMNAAFGGNLNFDNQETPQGQLATSTTAIIGNANDTFVAITNQVDPAFAAGRMQDAIGRIYFITRNPSEPTVVQATCTGLPGVVIPEGAIAQATDENLYVCTQAGTIPAGGTIALSFSCSVNGPVPCPEGSLNVIYQAIPGWDSVTNLVDGVMGNDTETRQAFEARRAQSVAKNSVGSLTSVLGAVLGVANVLDAYATENDSASPATVGGATLAANSLYVAVVGGDVNAVAKAIWSKKAPGCAYNGNTTVVVQDNNSGYSPPFPSYNVTFEIPPPLPILFAVSIANGPQVPSNAIVLVQNAIIAAFAGADGGPRARIGSTIYASRFTAPIAALGSWALIISLRIGSNNDSDAVAFSGRIAATTLTVSEVISGSLAIGQTISDTTGLIIPGTKITGGSGVSWTVSASQTVAGASFTGTGSGTNLTANAVTGVIKVGAVVSGTGVPANTFIVSQTSGTPGGAGVYVTSNATTSSSNALKADELMMAASANQNTVTVNINQVPTVSAAEIAVTLV